MIGLLWLCAAANLPIIQDEAYYFSWARHLDFGYFDHPPFVALISWPATIARQSFVVARLGTLLTSLLALLASWRLFRVVGLRSRLAQSTALLLAFGNLMGLVYGFITTPDTGLLLAWVLALTEAALALQGDERHWLGAGFMTGLGLWSKYMMLLIGPIFLWALVAQQIKSPERGKGLRGPWPYLGGLVALLVIAPHLYWNATHGWITLRFQTQHGFADVHIASDTASTLPTAQDALKDSPEWRLGQFWGGIKEDEHQAESHPVPYEETLKALNRYLGYYGSQVAAWGGLLGAIVLGLRRRSTNVELIHDIQRLTPEAKPLLVAATAVPLLVFGLLALVTKVEANWSAMYVVGAAPLLTSRLINRQRSLWIGLSANLVIVLLLLIHARSGILPVPANRDRLLNETHGYADLARAIDKLQGPVFADSYQITAMSNFYLDSQRLRQWPGITRDSEFVRRPEVMAMGTSELKGSNGFWLITTDMPRSITGFMANEMLQLRDCKDSSLQVISSTEPRESAKRCAKPVHEWYLVRYDALLGRG